MIKGLKDLGYQILYWIVLIASVLGILGIAFFGTAIVSCFSFLLTGNNVLFSGIIPGCNIIISILLHTIGFAALVFAEKALFQARIKVRHHTDMDEYGVAKKFSSYDQLSAKEKAEFDKQKLMDMESLIDTGTLRKITHPGSKNPDIDMNNLIGLLKVKEKMHEMAARMEYERLNEKNNKKNKKKGKEQKEPLSMHMCFLGPPGTGKTTCARIMAGFLYKYGYIKENKCIEVDGNFLKGRYKGETTDKTKLLLRKAKNGVLFIDEAYALLDGAGGDFGQEAIATIVKEMEDNRGDFVVIFAGYDNEMKTFINANPGIFSRIKHYLWFESYGNDDLCRIFEYMARSEEYSIHPEAMNVFRKKMEKERYQNNFGNARSVRNTLEKAIDKHATNIIDGRINQEYLRVICPDDIEVDTREANFFNV